MILSSYPTKSLKGEFSTNSTPAIPGDKSISHRAALLGGMAKGESRIRNFMNSGVTKVMLEALGQLGVEWELKDNELVIRSDGFHHWKIPDKPLHCGNSATTIRLLAGAVAAAGIPVVLDGSESLRKRPMERIIKPLQTMGVPIRGSSKDTAPLIISARNSSHPLKGMSYSLPVASAQVKTCLLLASLASGNAIELQENQQSRDHTERILRWLGLPIEWQSNDKAYSVRMGSMNDKELPCFELTVPGDFSSAAFLIVAGLIIPNSEIVLRNIGLNETRTGLLDALQLMGAEFSRTNRLTSPEPEGDISFKYSLLSGISIESDLVVRMIDEFPIFSIAALKASGITSVNNAKELRYKETDRISSLCLELTNIGAMVTEHSDGFSIMGMQPIFGGTVDPHRDHRLAMSLAVAGLVSSSGVSINSAEIINESFPAFVETLTSAGAIMTWTGID